MESFPQTVFVILTVLFGMAFGVSWFVRPGRKFFPPFRDQSIADANIILLVKLVEDPDDEQSAEQRRFRPVPEEVEDMEDVLAI